MMIQTQGRFCSNSLGKDVARNRACALGTTNFELCESATCCRGDAESNVSSFISDQVVL